MASAYAVHAAMWKDCKRCGLCERRQRVVLYRGTVPCDILFVGEAPGESEDVLGQPFVGPAGKLLDTIMSKAEVTRFTFGMTNLVGCIPRDEYSDKLAQPPNDAIDACSPRLIELAKICKPRLFVWVGELSAKWAPTYLPSSIPSVKIIHPAAILRMNVSQQGLAFQRAVVALAEAVEEL